MYGRRKHKITCNVLYCNHQVHRDFLITLYFETRLMLYKFVQNVTFKINFKTVDIICNHPVTDQC